MAEQRVPCMSCRELVSPGASRCPHCGGMTKRLPMGCIVALVAVFALIVLVLLLN